MKTNTSILFFLLASLSTGVFFISTGCSGNKKRQETGKQTILTVDVTKSYPVKRVSLQEIADIRYLPLETSDDFLWKGRVNAFTDKWIINTDRRNGNVLFFDSNGKAVKHFNRAGGSAEEYSSSVNFLWDEEKEEMFAYDDHRKHIYVYDMDGKLKRNLPYLPETNYYHMLHFDSDRLIAYKKVHEASVPNAFHILSKQTGELLEEIIIPVQNKISERVIFTDSSGNTGVAVTSIYPLLQHPSGWVLNDISNDTIFLLRPTLKLEPLVIAEPEKATLNPEVLLFFSKESNSYHYLMSSTKTFDAKSMKGFPYTYLMYDKKEEKMYEQDTYNEDFPSQPYKKIIPETTAYTPSKENQFIFTLEPMELIEANENGELKGKLKEIAATLKEDDNPVLMIATLK